MKAIEIVGISAVQLRHPSFEVGAKIPPNFDNWFCLSITILFD